jgi:hypothetical protein
MCAWMCVYILRCVNICVYLCICTSVCMYVGYLCVCVCIYIYIYVCSVGAYGGEVRSLTCRKPLVSNQTGAQDVFLHSLPGNYYVPDLIHKVSLIHRKTQRSRKCHPASQAQRGWVTQEGHRPRSYGSRKWYSASHYSCRRRPHLEGQWQSCWPVTIMLALWKGQLQSKCPCSWDLSTRTNQTDDHHECSFLSYTTPELTLCPEHQGNHKVILGFSFNICENRYLHVFLFVFIVLWSNLGSTTC